MKKITIFAFIAIAFLMASVSYADNNQDNKALSSASKKSAELKISLKLSDSQAEQVRTILYDGYSTITAVKNQSDLTKEQKIAKYNENSAKVQEELKKVLTSKQYGQYMSPARGN